MSLTKRIFVGVCLASSLLLTACGGSGASKGYSIRKSEMAEYYESLGLKDAIKYNSASYVQVVREGSKDVYFYKANYTVSVSTASGTYNEYFAWIDGDSYTQDSSDTAYNLAYSSVTSGAAKGSVGNL